MPPRDMPENWIVLPKQDGLGSAMGVKVFSGEHELAYVQDVELLYSPTDVTKARVTLLVSAVRVEERKVE